MFAWAVFFSNLEVEMKKLVAILTAMMMLFVLFGCQSTDVPAATTEIVAPVQPEPAPAPAPAPAPEAEPAPAPAEESVPAPVEEASDAIALTYEYMGYELGITADGGIAQITYPDWVTESDVAAFFAAEVEKYGAELDGILYMFTAPGTVEIAYPAEASADLVTAYIDSFVADLLTYVEGFDIQPAAV